MAIDERKLQKLYRELEEILNEAPKEDDCNYAQNEMYSDMANLKQSMINAGYNKL